MQQFYSALRSLFALFGLASLGSLALVPLMAYCESCGSASPDFAYYLYGMVAVAAFAFVVSYVLEQYMKKEGWWTSKGSFKLVLPYHRVNASKGFEAVLPETPKNLDTYIHGPEIWRTGLWVGAAFIELAMFYEFNGKSSMSFWVYVAFAVVLAIVPNFIDYAKAKKQMLSGDRLRSGEIVYIDAFGDLHVDIGIDGDILEPYSPELANRLFEARVLKEKI